jgi:hypothetical protein
LPFSHEADTPKAEAAFGGFCGPDWPGAPFIPESAKISAEMRCGGGMGEN